VLTRLGHFLVRRRRTVLMVAGIGLIVAVLGGLDLPRHLRFGGSDSTGSEYSRGLREIERDFALGNPNFALLVTAKSGRVDDPAVAAEGIALTKRLAAERGIGGAASYWTLGSVSPLRSHDGAQALVLGQLDGDQSTLVKRASELAPRFEQDGRVVSVRVGAPAAAYREISERTQSDLIRAEVIAVPITLVLLLLVYGGVVAATLPLAVGGFAVALTVLALRLLTGFTDVSVFALNLATAAGLALGIDYSLFVVSRFREELRAGREPHDAVVVTVETAGRTVMFGAIALAASLSALVVFPVPILRSEAHAGFVAALFTALGAVVVLPALLAVLGHNVDRWSWRRVPELRGDRFWRGVAQRVMRHPVPIALSAIALLLFLGAPFLAIKFGLPDDRVLPRSSASHKVGDAIRAGFSANETGSLSVVAVDVGDAVSREPDIDAYAIRLSRLEGVARVDALTDSYVRGQRVAIPAAARAVFASPHATWFRVVPSVEPVSVEGEALVGRVRATPGPFHTLVTGPPAELVDTNRAMAERLPLAIGLVAAVSLVMLFVMFGSVVVPLKALLMNFLSLTATFGAMVWIFQQGHLSGLLDFTASSTIYSGAPILMFCVAFGLSMDYEVFLLSRIKEEYDRTGDNAAAIAAGLERTGRIVTAAAALLSVVFLAFATSGVSFLKMMGIGLSLAIIMDATIIRALLVPAFMRLAGRANWWAPAPLRRLHERIAPRFAELSLTERPPEELAPATTRV